jgi:DNA-directed RNA polymerase specialized sigma24 family protein
MREFYRQIPRHEFPSATVPDRPILLSPDIVVEISERARAVQELLAGLPTMQRHVMAWTADGFSIAEIARATGRNEAAVRKNLQRARDTLKTRLAESQGGA